MERLKGGEYLIDLGKTGLSNGDNVLPLFPKELANLLTEHFDFENSRFTGSEILNSLKSFRLCFVDENDLFRISGIPVIKYADDDSNISLFLNIITEDAIRTYMFIIEPDSDGLVCKYYTYHISVGE